MRPPRLPPTIVPLLLLATPGVLPAYTCAPSPGRSGTSPSSARVAALRMAVPTPPADSGFPPTPPSAKIVMQEQALADAPTDAPTDAPRKEVAVEPPAAQRPLPSRPPSAGVDGRAAP